MLIDKTVSALLEDFSSPTPTPGGGSASALSGAIGASLLAMGAGMTKTRTGSAEERTALDDARTRLLAYDLVMAAYKRPKATDEEKAGRKAAIQAAMRQATDVPLETMRVCADALAAAVPVAEHGNPSAISDVAVGVGMLMQALQGGFYNVETNLGSVADPQVVETITHGARAVLASAGDSVRRVYQAPGFVELLKATAARAGRSKQHA
jgi:formiminotetrahydrofolate cyclodeaminase